MKSLILFALLVLAAQAQASDFYAYIGKGLRNGAYNVGIGYEPIKVVHGKLGVEVEFIDAGEQPEPNPSNGTLAT